MPPVDALKQGDRGEFVAYPGQLPRELRARPAPTTDQPRLWLVVRLIIGVRHETGNIVHRALVEATSVAGHRARVRCFRRIRSVRISTTSPDSGRRSRCIRTCCAMAAGMPWRTRGTTPDRSKLGSGTRTFSTWSAAPNWPPIASRVFGRESHCRGRLASRSARLGLARYWGSGSPPNRTGGLR